MHQDVAKLGIPPRTGRLPEATPATGSRRTRSAGRMLPVAPTYALGGTRMTGTAPVPFTADDYKARMDRAARQAADAGLAGLLVAPGPDLVWLTGYAPPAVTERLTLLVLAAGREPVLVVPTLEAPDAEKAPGAPALALRDWTDGKDPTPSPRPSSTTRGASASATTPGRCTCWDSSRPFPAPRTCPSPRRCRCCAP